METGKTIRLQVLQQSKKKNRAVLCLRPLFTVDVLLIFRVLQKEQKIIKKKTSGSDILVGTFFTSTLQKKKRERRANRINTISFILPGSFITERWGEEIHGTFNCHFHSVQKTIANNCPPLFSIRPIQKIDRSQPTGKNVS